MKKMTDNDLKDYLSKITDEALYSYNVYQIEGEGRNLFTDIDGDETAHRHLKPTDGNLPHRHSLQRSSPPHLWLTPTHESTALSKSSQPLL